MIKIVIGAFGTLIFEVSAQRVITFDNYKRTTKAKYAKHEIIGRPPVSEFVGRELESITLTITLISCLGVTPEEEALKLRDICQRGEPNFLIIGNTVYGENEFVITDVSESVLHWTGGGNVLTNKLDVTFEEYVPTGD